MDILSCKNNSFYFRYVEKAFPPSFSSLTVPTVVNGNGRQSFISSHPIVKANGKKNKLNVFVSVATFLF